VTIWAEAQVFLRLLRQEAREPEVSLEAGALAELGLTLIQANNFANGSIENFSDAPQGKPAEDVAG